MTRIETAGAEGGERLAKLHAGCFVRAWSADYMDGLIRTRECVALLACSGEGDLGFVLARVAADEAEILSVGVVESARRRHIATKLLRAAGCAVAELGAEKLFLEVAADNHAAVELYRKLGFRQVGRRAGYYEQPGADGLILRSALPLGNASEVD